MNSGKSGTVLMAESGTVKLSEAAQAYRQGFNFVPPSTTEFTTKCYVAPSHKEKTTWTT